MQNNRSLTGLVVSLTLAFAASAQAQTDKELVPDEIQTQASDKEGWYPKLTLGATIAFIYTDNVVGSQNGQTWNIGALIDFDIDWYSARLHEWRNALKIREVVSRTPVIDEFIKTSDSFSIESVYLLHIPGVEWLGPFVRATFDTAIFPGDVVLASSSTFRVKELDGTTADTAGDRLDLTAAFAPLKLTQSVGMFASPIDTEEVKVEFRAGLGAREVFVQNALVLTDDGDTPDVIEVTRAQDYQQLGGELFFGMKGRVTTEALGKDRPFLYAASVETLFPFFSTPDTGKSGIDLTTLDVQVSLGIKLFSWMSLDYNLRVVREPVILDAFQVQNNLLLNFSYTFFEE